MTARSEARRVKDRVHIPGIGWGWLAKVYEDAKGVLMFSVLLDDKACERMTPDGYYLARECEIKC